MSYRIQHIELYVRDTPPGRMVFNLGKHGGTGSRRDPVTSPLVHVRMIVADGAGRETFGCAGDRLSVRWLDKRSGRDADLKRRELTALIESAREVYRAQPGFDTPFGMWRRCHPLIMKLGESAGQEDLTSSFASALMERAVVDAVCRLEEAPVFDMVAGNRLGFDAAELHPEVGNLDLREFLPERPRTSFFIRHTVGISDPLRRSDIPESERIGDGLPESLEEYIAVDGVRYFKVKISGDVDFDLERLGQIWDVVLAADQPVLTLDANEAYADLEKFAEFVRRFDREQTGLFQHVSYIEQPLTRALTFDPKSEKWIREIAERKPLIIDEADGTVDAFERARKLGYDGTSHKNCKGFFKSLGNLALVYHDALHDRRTFLSAEDLQNLPVVPLQQDFATLGILGLEHCERNGHHYNYGLRHVSEADKRNAVRHHPDLYTRRGDEWFLDVQDGAVRCESLYAPGFGVVDEPHWEAMTPLRAWTDENHPA